MQAMNTIVNLSDLIGKVIEKAEIIHEDDSEYDILVLKTTCNNIVILQGSAIWDRCGDMDGIEIEELEISDLDFDTAKKLELYSTQQLKEMEEEKRKKEKERKRKAAYEKESKRKQKEEAELEQLTKLAEKFNLEIKNKS